MLNIVLYVMLLMFIKHQEHYLQKQAYLDLVFALFPLGISKVCGSKYFDCVLYQLRVGLGDAGQ